MLKCPFSALAHLFVHFLFLLISSSPRLLFFFFFNDTATTEIYTLSLHDALPISPHVRSGHRPPRWPRRASPALTSPRSEEHTSELQSHSDLVCRLLLEKKKKKNHQNRDINPAPDSRDEVLSRVCTAYHEQLDHIS